MDSSKPKTGHQAATVNSLPNSDRTSNMKQISVLRAGFRLIQQVLGKSGNIDYILQCIIAMMGNIYPAGCAFLPELWLSSSHGGVGRLTVLKHESTPTIRQTIYSRTQRRGSEMLGRRQMTLRFGRREVEGSDIKQCGKDKGSDTK